MRFAELTQEVVIDRAVVDTAEHKEGLVPGRRLANLASRGMAETDGPVVHPYKLALPPFNIEEVLHNNTCIVSRGATVLMCVLYTIIHV